MNSQNVDGELRLFLEELCCELCRLKHVTDEGIAPEAISIAREVQLARPSAFADIVVSVPGAPAYFVEIKYGLALEETVRSLRQKYAVNHRAACNRLIVVTQDLDPEALRTRLRDSVCPTLDIEVWGEARLVDEIKLRYGLEIGGFGDADVTTLHRSILQANWTRVFGKDAYYEVLASALLWHFSPWTLKHLHEHEKLGPEDIWRPGAYHDVAIVMADLSAFSRYVHDTPDERVMQQILTAFYSQTRHAVHEYGGMFYQFVGDEVIGVFGFPGKQPGYIADALNCAKALLDIGNSTSSHWERRIDLVQEKHGLHIGIAMGSLNLLPLRPFARSHIGFIGDSLNMTARLLGAAEPGEIVVSNTFFQGLDEDDQTDFAETGPLVAKNIGTVKGWRRAVVK